MANYKNLRIALAHDSFTQLGGAERVIETLHEIFPQAPVFTLVLDKRLKDKYVKWDIRVSFLQKLYNLCPKLQFWLFIIPKAVSLIKISEFDIVISSSSGLIKNLKVPKRCVHINYCHTPARFLWVNPEYINQEVNIFLRPLVKLFLIWMRKWDVKSNENIQYFIANSKEVQKRIKKYYNRDSFVLYPPISFEFWHKTREKQDYFLLAGRLQPHKNNELIIKVFNELGLVLHVAGTGRQESYLKSIAKGNIIFLGRVTDEVLRDEYSGALGFIYPQVEDFGLMPIEAAACGTASIGVAKGGSLETIISGVTGELFENYDIEQIKKLLSEWRPDKYQYENLQKHAKKFGKEQFEIDLIKVVERFI